MGGGATMSDDGNNSKYLWLIPLYLVLNPQQPETKDDGGCLGCLMLIVLVICGMCCLSWVLTPA
jgi:hypothetical protein